MANIDFELKQISDDDIISAFKIFRNIYKINIPCGDKLDMLRTIYNEVTNKISITKDIGATNVIVSLKSCKYFIDMLCSIEILHKKYDKKNWDYNSGYYLTEYFDYITEKNIVSILRIHKGLKNIIRLAKLDSIK